MAKHGVGSASLAFAALLIGAAACSSSSDSEDARADHPSPDARCPIVTRGGGCRAAGLNEKVTIATGGLLLPAAGFTIDDGGAYLAFSVRWGDARILSSKSDRPWSFGEASMLPWGLANGATGVTIDAKNALYFVAQTGTRLGLHRAMIERGMLAPPEPVVIDGTSELPSWPQAVGLADGRVLLAFVAPQREVFVGVDDGTGTRFGMRSVRVTEPDLSGVLAHVGTTARGSWVLTYQVADARWSFRSHVLVSRDEGSSWTDANGGSLAAGDVLDPFPIARKDEGADIYYAKKAVSEQEYTHIQDTEQKVWRRALHEDGSLGPEQAVTSSTLGTVAAPQPRRLSDGRIAMMFAVEHGAKESDLALVVLDGDAP